MALCYRAEDVSAPIDHVSIVKSMDQIVHSLAAQACEAACRSEPRTVKGDSDYDQRDNYHQQQLGIAPRLARHQPSADKRRCVSPLACLAFP